ncbi:hypothetical protein L1049_018460 [Liquidambar formosana]|uniref:COI1 F-box domain-containing protein n=1 Tax=Liquidambar formosana TaxID=63359 RepID=A0AAP0RAJ7_LIQFO
MVTISLSHNPPFQVPTKNMETLGDDELALILNIVDDPNDRKSVSQVCKQWLRVEGRTRSSLRVLEPDLLREFLPRFPNLLAFESSALITNSDLEFVSKTCPNIQFLDLNLKPTCRVFDEFDDMLGLIDVGDDGICEIATGCRKLCEVRLRKRKGIGDGGVISLVKAAMNLTTLDLGRCSRVTDKALEAIGAANAIRVLNLLGCSLITDCGLALLSKGCVSQTLKKLVISECDQITDIGVLFLQQMCCLEESNLAECGPGVTDMGGVAIAAIRPMKRLNFSWLINITDATLFAVAQDCVDLVAVDLTGCELITGAGIRAFANHRSLEALVLASCFNVCGMMWSTLCSNAGP